MKVCAYCKKAGPFTKEHIFPSNIIQKYRERQAFYNKRVDKFVYSDPVIKDVCANCNNNLLSKLDAYLSELYDQNLYVELAPGDNTEISYNYDLLLRSLLKISFNSSRASAHAKTVKAHDKFSQYILNGGYVSDIQLRLLVVTPAKIIAGGKLLDEYLPVTQLRCADIPYDGPLCHRFIIRLIAINSFWFYLIISHKPEVKDKWKKLLAGFSSWKIQPGIHLEKSSSYLNVPVNQTTYMHPDLYGSLGEAIQRG